MIKLRNLEKTISKLKIDLDKEIENKKSTKINEVLNSLKDATPVDTGNARDNWKISKSSIINETEYISNLNEGSSQQAPSFFIERTVLSHKGISPSGMIVKII